MAFDSWQGAAEVLTQRLASAEPALIDLANRLGINSPEDTDRVLLIARIEDAVSRVTGHNAPRACTPRQLALLTGLGIRTTTTATQREADAMINVAIARERLDALLALRPERGDQLVRTRARWSDDVGEIVEVSSIDRLGHIWVKGAGGYPTRPQDLCRRPS